MLAKIERSEQKAHRGEGARGSLLPYDVQRRLQARRMTFALFLACERRHQVVEINMRYRGALKGIFLL